MNFNGNYFGQKYYRIRYDITSLTNMVKIKDGVSSAIDENIEYPDDIEFGIDGTDAVNTTNLETDIMGISYHNAASIFGCLKNTLRAGKTTNYYPHFSRADSTYSPNRGPYELEISIYDLL